MAGWDGVGNTKHGTRSKEQIIELDKWEELFITPFLPSPTLGLYQDKNGPRVSGSWQQQQH